MGVSFIYPFNRQTKELEYYQLTTYDNLPKRGVKRIDLQYKNNRNQQSTERIFLVNQDKAVFALTGVCTHLGCLVNFNYHKNQFICPCHGGTYDISGKVISGPPNKPLKRLPIELRDGNVYVGLIV
ncbi:MAG: ubiquinol-cytochrome c reductase iron-sulfur subunit [Nitrospirae bacterium]|nr:ubiquinol-cytochrome c reductase iron-sulfur subunit [Nitrospirota bacterium]